MASVAPGTLLKLLQSMNSPAAASSPSDLHRSPTLQITAIAPATADLCPSRGFYLQLSDSLNSTYVALSDCDADANSLQIGQLVHLDRLLPSHPVPRVANLRPVPLHHRSPPPLAGSPQPLLLSFSSPSDPASFVIQPSNSNPPPRAVLSPRENILTAEPPPPTTTKKRFSSPSPRMTSAPNPKRQPSPVATPRCSSGSRSSSPVPSKCTVPSLVVAKEENRKAAREPSIVVPSRYRQPSPVAARKGGVGASPASSRRGSMSPGVRRLSGEGSGGSGGGKKKGGVVVVGIARDGGTGRGGLRRSWEGNSGGGLVGEEVKEKEKGGGGGGRCKVDQQAILRTQLVISLSLLCINYFW